MSLLNEFFCRVAGGRFSARCYSQASLVLLTLLGVSIAGLSLWAIGAKPDSFLSVTSPIVLHSQLGRSLMVPRRI